MDAEPLVIYLLYSQLGLVLPWNKPEVRISSHAPIFSHRSEFSFRQLVSLLGKNAGIKTKGNKIQLSSSFFSPRIFSSFLRLYEVTWRGDMGFSAGRWELVFNFVWLNLIELPEARCQELFSF